MALKQQAKSPSTEGTGTAQRAVHSGLLDGLGPDRETLPRGVLQGGLHLHSVVSRFFSRAASRDCSHWPQYIHLTEQISPDIIDCLTFSIPWG